MFGEGGRMMSEEIRAEADPRSPAFPGKVVVRWAGNSHMMAVLAVARYHGGAYDSQALRSDPENAGRNRATVVAGPARLCRRLTEVIDADIATVSGAADKVLAGRRSGVPTASGVRCWP